MKVIDNTSMNKKRYNDIIVTLPHFIDQFVMVNSL